jgi:hypothetical protein
MKPGWKTTEFWLSFFALILGAAMASGALPETGMAQQIVGGVLAILAQLGYTAARNTIKTGPTPPELK